MDTVSAGFAWGVFLILVGAIILTVIAVVRILVGQLVRFAARLQPVNGIVREETGEIASVVQRLAGPSYRLPFRYEYEIGGKTYSGSLATLQIDTAAKAAARAAFAARHAGEAITVYYDRDHPSRSALDNRPPAVPWWVDAGAIAGVVLLVAGAVLIATG